MAELSCGGTLIGEIDVPASTRSSGKDGHVLDRRDRFHQPREKLIHVGRRQACGS